ncbi:MAG: hypothetical protein D6800_06120 [Candidatus Zixiibacteriota bacterium]|nr:MAG: hypothetical protein D6800_06120 [candidate division Zixibacteria bacterium]
MDAKKQQKAEPLRHGSPVLLLIGFVLGVACYWLGWVVFSAVSSPFDPSTRLFPAIPAGLVFLHFYIRWYMGNHPRVSGDDQTEPGQTESRF